MTPCGAPAGLTPYNSLLFTWQDTSPSIAAEPLTSRCIFFGRPVRAGCPVRDEMTSTMMGAPHLAVNRSPERYLLAKVDRQRLCCAWRQRAQFLSRHPKLLQAGASGQATQDGLRPCSRSACAHWAGVGQRAGNHCGGLRPAPVGGCSCTMQGGKPSQAAQGCWQSVAFAWLRGGLYLHRHLGHRKGGCMVASDSGRHAGCSAGRDGSPCSAEPRGGVLATQFAGLTPEFGRATHQRPLSDV